MDPEHRKFVFAEDYEGDRSIKEAYSRRDRDLGVRRRSSAGKNKHFVEDNRRLGKIYLFNN